ncbi:hypothetical protein F4824DRAFT_93166 [Ustulina deusta]|nr:hypothetical protein F4824DRAFT_93166 [Ustulina deusta]
MPSRSHVRRFSSLLSSLLVSSRLSISSSSSSSLDVVAGDGVGARGAAVGQDGAALLDVDDGGAGDADGGAALDGRGAGEGDAVEVGEGHERAARLVVLDDPLGVVLAQLAALAAEGVRDRLARRQVLEGGDAGGLGGGRLCVVPSRLVGIFLDRFFHGWGICQIYY